MEADVKFISDLSQTYHKYERINRKLELQSDYAPLAWKTSVTSLREVIISGIASSIGALVHDSRDRIKQVLCTILPMSSNRAWRVVRTK